MEAQVGNPSPRWPQEAAARSSQGAGRGSHTPAPLPPSSLPSRRGGGGTGLCRGAGERCLAPVLPPTLRNWPCILGPRCSLQNGSGSLESPGKRLIAVGTYAALLYRLSSGIRTFLSDFGDGPGPDNLGGRGGASEHLPWREVGHKPAKGQIRATLNRSSGTRGYLS